MSTHLNDGAPPALNDDIRAWNVSRLARFLRSAAHFLEALDYDALSHEDRSALIRSARDSLPPLMLTPRQDPRTEIVQFLHRFLLAPDLLAAAARVSLTGLDGPHPPEENCQLLDVLVEAAVDGERIAFQVVDLAVILAMPKPLQARAQSALCFLASAGGALPALAMAERLRSSVGLEVQAAVDILRMVASRQPGMLIAAFQDLRSELETSAAEPWLVDAVRDMARRASDIVFLKAVAQLNTQQHPRLIKAAFGGIDPIFRLAWRREVTGFDEEGMLTSKYTLVIQGSSTTWHRDILVDSITDHKTWHLDVLEIAQVRPDSIEESFASDLESRGRTPQGLIAAAAKGEGGLKERFARQMLH